MTDALPPPVPSQNTSPRKSGRNCWVVGCSGCLITLAVLVILGMVVSWQIKRKYMVEPFEQVELSAAEEEQAREKLQSLNLLDEGGNAPSDFEIPEQGLLLTETEMNYWISQLDNEIADSVRLDFEPGEVTAEVRAGETDGKRWLLIAKLSLSYEDEILDVRLLDLKLGPFTLPESVMAEFEKENMATEAFEDPETREAFQSKVERIEILKDRILFVPKPGAANQP